MGSIIYRTDLSCGLGGKFEASRRSDDVAAARQACNIVLFGPPNRKCGTFVQHRAGIGRSAEHKCPQFPHFRPDHFVDMVGVTGSIPVAPTINPRHFLFFGKVLAPVGAMAQVDGERARA